MCIIGGMSMIKIILHIEALQKCETGGGGVKQGG